MNFGRCYATCVYVFMPALRLICAATVYTHDFALFYHVQHVDSLSVRVENVSVCVDRTFPEMLRTPLMHIQSQLSTEIGELSTWE